MEYKVIRRALLVGPVAMLGLTSGIASGQVRSAAPWRAVAVVAKPSRDVQLFGVAAGDRRHAWAVGLVASHDLRTIAPVARAWNGSAWKQVRLPAGVMSGLSETYLDTVTAFGRHDVWAFTPGTRWLHGNGTQWSTGSIPGTWFSVDASLAVSASTVWAFGGTRNAGGRVVPRAAYNAGAGWTRIPVPGTGVVTAASAVSRNDIWAVLGKGHFAVRSVPGGLVHWHAGRWHRVATLPAQLRGGLLGAVLARSDRNVWVGGAVTNTKKGTTEAVGHWNGHRWTVVTLRASASTAAFQLTAMVSDGAGGIWAVGSCFGYCPQPSRLWHEAAGRWSGPIQLTLAGTPAALIGLATVGQSVWGVGSEATKTAANGLIALWGTTP